MRSPSTSAGQGDVAAPHTSKSSLPGKGSMRSRDRFAFGANWARFLRTVNEERIATCMASLQTMLEVEHLAGQRFLDVGSGSGIFSLAARRLGATVHSFDCDSASAACTAELRRRYSPDDAQWAVETGSVLDRAYLARLGRWHIVYAWGVLHHTGDMWQAMENVIDLVRPGGVLFLALYNDQGYKSRLWALAKRTYNRHPVTRPGLVAFNFLRAWGLTSLLDLLFLRPFSSWRTYKRSRGMSPWWDVLDWIGGWPYEVATADAVFDFYRHRGFTLRRLVTSQGIGCNQFLFDSAPALPLPLPPDPR